MRAIIQRVKHASVTIGGVRKSEIQQGLLVLLGIEAGDTAADLDWMAKKIAQMRIFSDSEGKMNLSLQDVNGDLMVVSQFTLYASTQKGNRPSFLRSARPEHAIPIYEELVAQMESITGKKVATGEFGADMQVELLNDGPVTIFIDSQLRE